MTPSVHWASRISSKTSGIATRIATHERIVGIIVAFLTAAIVFEPRVRGGGFNADDWALYSAVRFPHARGFSSVLGALQHSAGSRIGHMFYWFICFTLFGDHTRLYTTTAAMLGVVMAFALYMVLRELRFSFVSSLGIMLFTLVAPSVATLRFWFTPAGTQICLALFFIGLMLAIRAFHVPDEKRIRLHCVSWGLYFASAVYAETALPLMGVSILVYLTQVRVARALRRWLCDLVIVVAGYIAALSFVNSTPGFTKIPSSMWGEHAHLIGDQALTIFTKMLMPVGSVARSLELIALTIFGTAALVLWWRGEIPREVFLGLRRWGITLGISITAIVASYAVFVPAMLYYEPLGPGLATHINSTMAGPLAVAVFAVVMLVRTVTIALFNIGNRRAVRITTIFVTAWVMLIIIGGGIGVRGDAHIWAFASERANDVLRRIKMSLPTPAFGATIYTFGEAGTAAPGLPIFFTSWELDNAVKLAYNRPDLSAYPMVVNGIQPHCTPSGIIASVESISINLPSVYRRSYFLDIPSGRVLLVKNFSSCIADLSQFHIGPYVSTSLKWSLS
jgi:hypothetical protein